MKITLPDGTPAHIRITANPIAGRPATRRDLLYALDYDKPPLGLRNPPGTDPNLVAEIATVISRYSQDKGTQGIVREIASKQDARELAELAKLIDQTVGEYIT